MVVWVCWYDFKVIVEVVISGCELECGVFEMLDGILEVSMLGEIWVVGVWGCEDFFYDFVIKYFDDVVELDVFVKVDD